MFEQDQLYFIPLGGSEEFGTNLNVYSWNGDLLAIDCGIGFADHNLPLVDIVLPDPTFLRERKQHLKGMIITHAHEDHIGAVAYLWKHLQCPIYCTPFTAAVLRHKFNDQKESGKGYKIIEVEPYKTFSIGPFKIHPVPVTHSIPESASYFIETPKGNTVLHSGDWNMDATPVIGKPFDKAPFVKAGEQGLMAYIGDSTNANVQGRGTSEQAVEEGLEKLFAEVQGRIAITMFSSNIGRIQSIMKAAQKDNRSVCVIGRSLHRMIGCAYETGYLRNMPEFIDEDDLSYLPADKTVLVVTGSQGEPQSALARIARGDYEGIKLGKGDTVIFSARAIPGNEKEINAVKNMLAASKVRIITPDDTKYKIHSSGHPYADEVRDMFGFTKPKAVIPVHGERMHLEAQGDIARECGVKHVVIPKNGSVIRITPDGAELVGEVETGHLAVEPNRVIATDHEALRARRKLQYSGAVHISLAMTARGDFLPRPRIDIIGLVDPEYDGDMNLQKDIQEEISDIMMDIDAEERQDVPWLEEELRKEIRKYLQRLFGFKPLVNVHILQV
ncbi:MAG: MBL fold metallo-hydrolase [Alphaproteobacteria bacterium]|nr:MBL fold metallo-hydrolase [Alphaproteobacteria bacterium]